MQRVIHRYNNISPVFMMIEELYSYISDYDDVFDDIIWLDKSFKPLCKILEQNLFKFITPKYRNYEFKKIPSSSRDKVITVCLSGGKDSAAAAYYYKQRGYEVHLYHATGVNRAYGDEKTAAQQIADYLGCDLFIDKFQLAGKQKFIEHPLKNYIIANGAIHYALNMGFPPTICFGNFNQSKLDDNAFEVCAGDCIEMWQVYEPIIQTVIPNFKIEIPLRTNADTFNLLSEDWQLFRLAVSCMSPFRFREHWKHRTEQKYGVRLFNNRCGCCWKDCLESMWLMDNNKVEYNEDFYIHCFEILERTVFKEIGTPGDSVQSIWDSYMFYPIEESKAYNILKDKKLITFFS